MHDRTAPVLELHQATVRRGERHILDGVTLSIAEGEHTAFIGPNGSGKSSLIRAGLMPALRGGMMAGAGSGWRIAVMRPGGDPIGNLAIELAKKEVLAEAGAGLDVNEAEAVIDATLRGGSLGIVDVARQGRLGPNEKLLVVVDQFEELLRRRIFAKASEDWLQRFPNDGGSEHARGVVRAGATTFL